MYVNVTSFYSHGFCRYIGTYALYVELYSRDCTVVQ